MIQPKVAAAQMDLQQASALKRREASLTWVEQLKLAQLLHLFIDAGFDVTWLGDDLGYVATCKHIIIFEYSVSYIPENEVHVKVKKK